MSESSDSKNEESHDLSESVGLNIESNDRALLFFTHVSVPPRETVIKHASYRCHINLKVIELPNGLEVIKEYAFEGCEKLTTVVLPKASIY